MAQQFPTGISQPATQFQWTASLRAAGIGVMNPVSLRWPFTTSPPLNCHYLTPLQNLVVASTVLLFHHPWMPTGPPPVSILVSLVQWCLGVANPQQHHSHSLTRIVRLNTYSVLWYIQANALDYLVFGFLRSPATVTSPSTLGPVADSVHPDV